MFTVFLDNLNYFQIPTVFIFTVNNVFILMQEADGFNFLRFYTMETMPEAVFYPKCVMHVLTVVILEELKPLIFFKIRETGVEGIII